MLKYQVILCMSKFESDYFYTRSLVSSLDTVVSCISGGVMSGEGIWTPWHFNRHSSCTFRVKKLWSPKSKTQIWSNKKKSFFAATSMFEPLQSTACSLFHLLILTVNCSYCTMWPTSLLVTLCIIWVWTAIDGNCNFSAQKPKLLISMALMSIMWQILNVDRLK